VRPPNEAGANADAEATSAAVMIAVTLVILMCLFLNVSQVSQSQEEEADWLCSIVARRKRTDLTLTQQVEANPRLACVVERFILISTMVFRSCIKKEQEKGDQINPFRIYVSCSYCSSPHYFKQTFLVVVLVIKCTHDYISPSTNP
jgi:hypothetical protein